MASFIQRVTALITAIKTETKALRTIIAGTSNGNASGLQTTATNLVAAINEVRALAAAGSGASQQDIDDAVAALRTELLGGAGTTVDTLKEIADLLASNTSTDAALAVIVSNKANSSDVYTQAQIGNPDTDLVALWEAA
ncbi:MAG: hypothetical protein C0510_07515 [Erythrobacter sp.]|nr:hypothetical protein [Erythrobacter sp.]MBA4080383.1 hypothetical protein [Erythrobacter sp.]MBA4164465.1 hypothetical protein [Erythrobacter sp.]